MWTGREAPSVVGIHTGTLEVPMTTTTSTRTPLVMSIRQAGAWCLGGGLLGAAEALAVLAWSPQVSGDRFSYPFNSPWYFVAEACFVLQHMLLVPAGLALLSLPAVRASSTARIAAHAAVAGLVLLVITELSALSLYDAATDSTEATVITTLFLLPVMLIGVGLTAAGVALLRRGTAGWAEARWLPFAILATGVYVFVALSPTMNGSDTAGRLGIGGWMLMFAILGYGLTRIDGRDA
jgi:hypothetical protein